MQERSILSASVITASGNSGALAISPQADAGEINGNLDIEIQVTAASGTTPSATFSLQWSDDGVNFASASPADAFSAITAATNVLQQFSIKAPYYQLVWTVTGTTPSFTVTATAES